MNVSQRGEMTREITTAVNHSTGSFELLCGAAIFALVGFGIDSWANTSPWFTLIFALIGFVGAAGALRLRYQDKMTREAEHRVQLAERAR